MLINRIMEIPLPTPFSVICSPSHIINAAPAVKAATATTIAVVILLCGLTVPNNPWFLKPITIAAPSITASAIER